MLNVAALSLVLLSLVTAGVWSPDPVHQVVQRQGSVKSEEPKVLVSEGQRVIVVEYERKGVLDAAKKGTHDAIHTAADYAELTGHNIRNAAPQVEEAAEKAANVVGRGAHKVEEAGEQVVQVIRSGADKTKDTVKSTTGKVKDKASSVLHHPGSEKDISTDDTAEGHVMKKSEELYTSAKEKISEAVESVRDAAASAKERFKDRYQEATSHLPKVGQGIVIEENADLYGLYGDSNPESTRENANARTFGEHINKAGESLKAASQRLREVAAEKWEKINTLKDEAQETYRENLESAKLSRDTAFEKAEQGLTRSSQAVKEKVEDAYDSAKGKVSGTGEKIKESAEEACDSAKGKLSGAGQKIKGGAEQTFDSAKGKVSDTGEKIKGSAEEAYDSAEAKISGTGQKIKEGAEQTFESAKGKVSDTGEKIKGSAEEAYDSAKGKISGTGQKIKEGAEQTYDSAKGKVSDTGEILKESAGHTYDSAKSKVSGAGHKIKENAEQAFDSVKGRVAGVGEKIKDDAKQTYDAAKGKVSGDSTKDLTSGGKDSQEFDNAEHRERNIRIQRVLRHAGEVATEKFRLAMNEVYRMSTKGSHVPENAKDVETRTTNLLKDAVINITDGSYEQSRWLPSRFERLPSRESMKVGTRILHLLAFSTIFGSSVWVNLLAGHVLAATIPRQQFALIQSKMYPLYFNTMAFGLSICLLTHPAIHPSKSETQRSLDYNLLLSLLFTLANLLILEPRTTKVVFEKLRVEKEERRGTDMAGINDHTDSTNEENVLKSRIVRLNRKLKLLHRFSSLVNMLTLMSLSWHLVYLSSYLKDTVV